MANYLQRIADSGARTSSIAKPPAAARGLMPPVGPVRSAAIGEEVQQPMENPADPLIAGRGAAVALPESEPTALPLREATPDDKSKAGKSVPPPVAIPQRITARKSASQALVRAPGALRAAGASIARERSVQKVAEETIRTFAPRALANRSGHDQPVPAQAQASEISLRQSIPVPRQTAEQKVIAPADLAQNSSLQERVGAEEGPATIEDSKTVSEIGRVIKEASPRLPLEARSTRDQEKDRGTGKTLAAGAEAQTKTSMDQESLREKALPETRWLQASSTSPARSVRQPAPAEPRRKTQISIGRIDVQVNNQAPPQAASQETSRVPARMNSLDHRYLGRFFLTV